MFLYRKIQILKKNTIKQEFVKEKTTILKQKAVKKEKFVKKKVFGQTLPKASRNHLAGKD